MKTVINTLLLLFITLLSQAQNQDLTNLSYDELDSLGFIYYKKNAFDEAIPYLQAGREKAKAEFGEMDSVFAEYTYDLGFFYVKVGQYEKAEQLLLQAKNIRAKILGEVHPSFATSLNALAALYQDIGDYEKAESLLLQANNIRAKVLGRAHPDFARSLNNLALLYQTMGNYEKAEPLYLQAKDIRAQSVGEEHPTFATSLNNLAELYRIMSRYEKAEPLYLQAQSIQTKVLGEEHPSLAISLSNLATLYVNMSRYEKAEPLYLQAQSIQTKVLGEEHPSLAISLSNLAELYRKMGSYKKAEPLYLQIQNIKRKALGEEHPSFATSLNNLALLYRDMGNYKKAEQLYLQAKNIRAKTLGEDHPDFAQSLNNLAVLYHKMDKLDTALRYCYLGIASLSSEINSSFEAWETLDKLKYTSNEQINISIQTLLSILDAQYKKTGDKGKLQLHYQIAGAAIRLNERIRNEFSAENDKLRNLAVSSMYVLQTIETGLRLRPEGYVQDAFASAEMNKGVLLMDAAKTDRAYSFGNLPDSLVNQEKQLQKKYAKLNAALVEKRLLNEKDSLNTVLNKLNQEIDAFNKKLKATYPKYMALKYENQTAKAAEIQALLDDKTALVEYVLGDSAIYTFYIDKKTIRLLQMPVQVAVLKKNIKALHQSLSDYEALGTDPEKSRQVYTTTAFWCYENLLKELLSEAKDIDQLIIVPDGELAHLPFEVFLVENPSESQPYSDFHYLLKDYKISYNYSATLWKENIETKKNKNNSQFFAMAANYTGEVDSLRSALRLPTYNRLRQILQALPAAREEVEALSKSFRGFFGLDNNATEKVFKEKAGEYAIIHLAMHGLLDNQNPILSSLAFTEDGDSIENNFLQAYEISKMELNADLVVLSACETGFGKFEKGNGTASLARAFMYAGVPAMVVSLWQVNDASTSLIMQLFYKNLARGMDKAAALQQAKLTYVKTIHESSHEPMAAHPAFWAPFIQLGDSRPIAVETRLIASLPQWGWWIGGGLLVVAAVGIGAGALRRKGKEN